MSEKHIRLEDAMPLICEQLKNGKTVTFSPRGTSMLPMIKEGRDSVTLSAPPEKLKKYDIPLYKRKNGQYVIHRVVKVGKDYTCIGDNQFDYEKGIAHSQVIALCTAITKNGKTTSVYALKWRVYAVLWHYSRFGRRIILAIINRLRKALNAFKR